MSEDIGKAVRGPTRKEEKIPDSMLGSNPHMKPFRSSEEARFHLDSGQATPMRALPNPYDLPPNLPVPEKDGACDHLVGMSIPHIKLSSTFSRRVDLGEACIADSVLFVYPATGKPGAPIPEGWDSIPGARGCTPESCSYRDHYTEFRKEGFQVFGMSSQSPEVQREFEVRNKIPYEILSDSDLEFAKALRLPTFTVKSPDPTFPTVCIKRLTLVVKHRGKIEKVFYPIFPPDKNASEVLEYIRSA